MLILFSFTIMVKLCFFRVDNIRWIAVVISYTLIVILEHSDFLLEIKYYKLLCFTFSTDEFLLHLIWYTEVLYNYTKNVN